MVSAVSPDCDTVTTSVFGSVTGSRYRYSLATSTSHGIPATASNQYFAVNPA